MIYRRKKYIYGQSKTEDRWKIHENNGRSPWSNFDFGNLSSVLKLYVIHSYIFYTRSNSFIKDAHKKNLRHNNTKSDLEIFFESIRDVIRYHI